MRLSKYVLFTLKENPSNVKIVSHKLMVRAGLVRKLSSGLYYWLPTGVRVLKKIKKIIRKEMNKIGSFEISIPFVQPIYLWEESGRIKEYGSELVSFLDRSLKSFVLSPTNEEAVSNLISNELFSFRKLPLILYQIHMKFRDELRPRFGVVRSKEFIMKDAYSFHTNKQSLKNTYDIIFETYNIIFNKVGLIFKVVEADNGSIGGNISHEFQALTDNGEDQIVFSKNEKYAVKLEFAKVSCFGRRNLPKKKMQIINVKNINTIFELVENYKLSIDKVVKTIIVYGSKFSNSKFIALLIRADHQLNISKAGEHFFVKKPVQFATEYEIKKEFLISSFFLGPVNLKIPFIVDQSVSIMSDFVVGSNYDNKYYFGVNWDRDLLLENVWDLRNIVKEDLKEDSNKNLEIKNSIEIGHIFQLGTKYFKVNKSVIKHNDKKKKLNMGCYGIGISRMVSAIIEQNHDSRGIIWPELVSPFQLAIIPVNMYQFNVIQKISEKIYFDLKKNRIDVIFDDRKKHFGSMLSDIELIGIPHIIIIGKQFLNSKRIEYRNRRKNSKILIKSDKIIEFLLKLF